MPAFQCLLYATATVKAMVVVVVEFIEDVGGGIMGS